jgi:anti-sigma regulatory factor (Ser/Thr protein kinase)
VRSGAAAGHTGYFHETAFYGSDEEFVAIVAPFLRDGLVAGEPVLVACGPHNSELIRRAVGSLGLRFLPGADQYARPGPTIRSYRSMFAELVAGGAAQIRVVGDVPHPGVGMDWHGWLRYEAAVNEAFDDFPLWGLCPYDTRITPDSVLADVAAAHSQVADTSGHHHRNQLFVDPRQLLEHHPSRRQPLARPSDPDVVLAQPTPRQARQALRDVATAAGLDDATSDDLMLAATEALENAIQHGAEPVRFAAWRTNDRVIVSITDHGTGLADPLVGLLPPAPHDAGGRGMWLLNQLCTDVRTSTIDGFEIQLTVTAHSTAA